MDGSSIVAIPSGILSGILGFAPAMALLFYTLRPYAYPAVPQPFFDDRKVFFLFALGIPLGMFLFAVQGLVSAGSTFEYVPIAVLLYSTTIALLFQVILNFRRFQRKIDTAFYGVSFGLGFGAAFAFGMVETFSLTVGGLERGDLVLAAVLGIQTVFLFGALGGFIGVGCARGRWVGYLAEALLYLLVANLLLIPFFDPALYPWGLLALAAALAVPLFAYWRLHTEALPWLIRDAKRLAAEAKAKVIRRS